MINLEDTTQYLMVDFDFSGMAGNPAVDAATWILYLCAQRFFVQIYEERWLEDYWKALIRSGNVDFLDYSFEKFMFDYNYYGSAQVLTHALHHLNDE